MKIRKQVYELKPIDLMTHPVWEFALDEEGESDQDEATVRPRENASEINWQDGMCIVRARFKLADGTEHLGYLTPGPKAMDLGTTQPQIVTDRGQIGFWMGSITTDTRPRYALLQKNAFATFPVSFESDVPLKDGVMKGSIPAFLQLIDWRTGTVNEIK